MTEPTIDHNHPQYEARIVDMDVHYSMKGSPPKEIRVTLELRHLVAHELDIVVRHQLTLPVPTRDEMNRGDAV